MLSTSNESSALKICNLLVSFFFHTDSTCDEALGMTDGSIKNDQIAASSYLVGSEPHEGRLGGNAWIPDGELS